MIMKRICLLMLSSAVASFLMLTSCNTGSKCTGSCCNGEGEKHNPAIENIFARKSVRDYDSVKTISPENMELIIKAGMAAPSGMNKQPWQFFVFSGKEEMASLSEKLPYAKMLKKAPAAVVVLGNPEISKLWYLDCAAATQNILLAAESLGIGAVWTAAFPYDERMNAINTALGIPEPWLPLALIPMGYPAGENMPKDKWDPAKVHYNKW